MKKQKILVLNFFLIASQLWGVSGISSTKLILPTANVLSPEKYEFDVNFYWLRSNEIFQSNGKAKKLQECGETGLVCVNNPVFDNNFTFRLTYGLGNQSELGFETGFGNQTEKRTQDFFYSYVDDIKLGYKYLFLDGPFKASTQVGLSFDVQKYVPLYEVGLIFTKDWENFSIDLDLHYFTTSRIIVYEEEYLEQASWYHGPHVGIGLGYTIGKVQLSVEYHFEQAQTKTIRSVLFNREDEERIRPLTFLQKLENPDFEFQNPHIDELLGLPHIHLKLDTVIDEHIHFANIKNNYYEISNTLYYGIIYNFAPTASISFLIGETIAGSNVNKEFLGNIITTFAF
ncbi:MAG: hypothetical protein NZ853_02545 [Leptospiraceae bacterium]|nr:hypothetical protein [Leptospiraceae bacterium]MDW7975059.1 hypothetical protein [Leptospiraceae bacterium]